MAVMICDSAASIEYVVREKPRRPPAPTFVDHLYSCRYEYPEGVMVLSVKESPDMAATVAYFMAMRDKHPGGRAAKMYFSQMAYVAPDGSVLVSSNFKVLWVDVSGLRDGLGTPPPALSASAVAFHVAEIFLAYWGGA